MLTDDELQAIADEAARLKLFGRPLPELVGEPFFGLDNPAGIHFRIRDTGEQSITLGGFRGGYVAAAGFFVYRASGAVRAFHQDEFGPGMHVPNNRDELKQHVQRILRGHPPRRRPWWKFW